MNLLVVGALEVCGMKEAGGISDLSIGWTVVIRRSLNLGMCPVLLAPARYGGWIWAMVEKLYNFSAGVGRWTL